MASLGLVGFFGLAVVSFAYEYPSKCPRVKPVAVDLKQFSGAWYEFIQDEEEIGCSAYFSKFITVQNEQIEKCNIVTKYKNGTLEKGVEYFRVLTSLIGNYSDTLVIGEEQDIDSYMVLVLNDSAALTYNCDLDEDGKIEHSVAIITRTLQLDEKVRQSMMDVLKSYKIDVKLQNNPIFCHGLEMPKAD